MNRVLITGMTSAQYNGARGTTFARLLEAAATMKGYDAVIAEPPLVWEPAYIEQFSKIFIGLAPVNSVAANNAYGALTGIKTLWDDPRLVMYIDAPDPMKIKTGLTAALRVGSESYLFKDVFRTRKHFTPAMSDRKNRTKISLAVELLNGSHLPTSIYPIMPFEADLDGLPPGAAAVNLDTAVARHGIERAMFKSDTSLWVATDFSSPWTTAQRQLVHGRVESLTVKRAQDDAVSISRLKSSVGLMHGPMRNGQVWWSQYVSMALAAGVPVATAWERSADVSHSWSVLPGTIEALSSQDWIDLAAEQATTYFAACEPKLHAFIDSYL